MNLSPCLRIFRVEFLQAKLQEPKDLEDLGSISAALIEPVEDHDSEKSKRPSFLSVEPFC